MPVEYAGLPFDEQIQFFRDKLELPSKRWSDIYTREHDFAFVVAGAAKGALLTDLRKAVQRAIEDGTTLEQFRRDFDAIVRRRGWTGWTGEGSRAGRAWRTRVIYETNLRTSYAAGRYQQAKDQAENRPYWRYRHSPAVEDPREQHLAWDGLVLRHDDAWWDTHYPPNGWGCQCFVETLRAEQVPEGADSPPDAGTREVDVPNQGRREVPVGVDPGFEYAPGQARHSALVRAPQTPPAVDEIPAASPRPGDALPAPQPVAASEEWPGDEAPDEERVRRFLAEFDADLDQPVRWEDAAGESLLVGRELFVDRSSGDWRLPDEPAQAMPRLAQALRSPDEIWARLERQGGGGLALRRRYIARLRQAQGDMVIAVLEHGEDGWWGVVGRDADLEQIRGGVRLYRRRAEPGE